MRLSEFWDHVAVDMSTGCLLWTRRRNRDGYGMLHVKEWGNKPSGAHRVSWVLANGEIPEGMCVCHKCDNPACVNPDHLFLGSHTDNMRDCASKERFNRKGEKHNLAILTEEAVRAIRSSNKSLNELAREYGVRKPAIYKVKKRLTWRHVA